MRLGKNTTEIKGEVGNDEGRLSTEKPWVQRERTEDDVSSISAMYLATSRGVTADRGRVADMLMVTTTVGVLHGVHGNTTDAGPAVTLRPVLVHGTASLCATQPAAKGTDDDREELGKAGSLSRGGRRTTSLCKASRVGVIIAYVLSKGLSVRPPPATMPTMARDCEGRTFLLPDGRRTRVLPVSRLCAMMVA